VGAQRAVQILVDELRLAMTLLGCPSVAELDASWVTAATPTESSSAWST
jgi:isopentenyl diphosphate isomerase/L-lactate dehydrogenase-like FMN-dependent dehydrogenase